MLRKLQELFFGRAPGGAVLDSRPTSSSVQQAQFDGQLLDRRREDVYALMHQQVSSLR
ncbi:hypothetical protein ACFUTU_02455 [Arthrobacter sp. NPDC057388]|jgi:hypothetical protein|uniref:hypothetical protein n=1 Tax=Arthrobacter sp. NPDC057388 TaxID=3346116 RepID=UPI00363936B2